MTKILTKSGDVFIVPLMAESKFGVGQVIQVTPKALNSVVCVYFDLVVDDARELSLIDFSGVKPISILFTTPDLLKKKVWVIVEHKEPLDVSNFIDLTDLEQKRYMNVDIVGSGIIAKFLSAYNGYYPWNSFYKEDFLDGFLINKNDKPKCIFFK